MLSYSIVSKMVSSHAVRGGGQDPLWGNTGNLAGLLGSIVVIMRLL